MAVAIGTPVPTPTTTTAIRRRVGVVIVLISMCEPCTRVQDAPDVVHHLPMCPHHIKVEPIRVLPLEVAQEGLAEACRLHHSAHRLALEEGVELRHRPVKGLGVGAGLEVKVHLFRPGRSVAGGVDECCELLGMECGVLDGRVGEPAEGKVCG